MARINHRDKQKALRFAFLQLVSAFVHSTFPDNLWMYFSETSLLEMNTNWSFEHKNIGLVVFVFLPWFTSFLKVSKRELKGTIHVQCENLVFTWSAFGDHTWSWSQTTRHTGCGTHFAETGSKVLSFAPACGSLVPVMTPVCRFHEKWLW